MAECIKEPIIMMCDVLYIFETVEEATIYIEPWDTEDCNPAYDSEGRLLRVFQSNKLEERLQNKVIEPKPKQVAPSWVPAALKPFVQWLINRPIEYTEQQLADFKTTRIEALEQEPTHQSELRELLTDWLVDTTAYFSEHKRKRAPLAVPVTKDELSGETLEQLVRRAVELDAN